MCGWVFGVVPYLSHPRIILLRKHIYDVRHSHVEYSHAGSSYTDGRVPSNDASLPQPPPHGANAPQRLQLITFIMNNLMGLVNPHDKVYSLASQTSHIAREGLIQTLLLFLCIICILCVVLLIHLHNTVY